MTRVRITLVLLAALVLQASLGSMLQFDGIVPDLLLLVAIAAGIAGGTERGALVGFTAGIAADLVLRNTPFGLSAMVFSIVGFGVGLTQTGIVRNAWWLSPFTVLAGSAAGTSLFALVGATVGQGHFIDVELLRVVVVVSVGNALLSVPFVAMTQWAMRKSEINRAFV